MSDYIRQTITVSSCQSDISNQCRIKGQLGGGGGGVSWRVWGGGGRLEGVGGGGFGVGGRGGPKSGAPMRDPLLPYAYLQGGCVSGAGLGKLLVAVVKQGP